MLLFLVVGSCCWLLVPVDGSWLLLMVPVARAEQNQNCASAKINYNKLSIKIEVIIFTDLHNMLKMQI